MNVAKQHSSHLRGHARNCASSGSIQSLLSSSFASFNAGLDDNNEGLYFGGSLRDSSLAGRGDHPHDYLPKSGNIVDILDEVAAVLGQTKENFYDDLQQWLVEPTPIAIDLVQIVDQVQVTENLWHMDDTYLQVLHPLLAKRKHEDEREVDDEEVLHRPSKKRMALTSSCSPITRNTTVFVLDSDKSTANSDDNNSSNTSNIANHRFRGYQAEQWSERYEELVAFCDTHGHCLVPHSFPENPTLSQWVKRQRYQYKLLTTGKHSTLTRERVLELESLGFVWDSHAAAWEERLDELRLFKAKHGHTHVPSNYRGNPSLAVWIKCQRRQQRKFFKGEPSNMTHERIQKLNAIGFVWNPRSGTK